MFPVLGEKDFLLTTNDCVPFKMMVFVYYSEVQTVMYFGGKLIINLILLNCQSILQLWMFSFYFMYFFSYLLSFNPDIKIMNCLLSVYGMDSDYPIHAY